MELKQHHRQWQPGNLILVIIEVKENLWKGGESASILQQTKDLEEVWGHQTFWLVRIQKNKKKMSDFDQQRQILFMNATISVPPYL